MNKYPSIKLLGTFLFILLWACNSSSNPDNGHIPSNAHNNEKTSTPEIAIDLPYQFKTTEAESLSVSAHDLAMQSRFKSAIDLYRQAIQIEGDNPKLYFDLADCYSHILEFRKAIGTLNKAISLDSSFAPFFNNRGLYNYRLYNDDAAITDYKKAIQLDSAQGIYFANLAVSYYSLNRSAEACAAFQKAKSLEVNFNDYKKQKEVIGLFKMCH